MIRTERLSTMLITLFLAAVFVLATTKTHDTDSWMHLSLGRLIWLQRGLPATETQVFTAVGLPFLYTSWLFGLALYLLYAAGGINAVIIVKASIVTALFGILLRDALRPAKNIVVALLVLTATVIMVRHRFVERPDLVSLLVLAFTVFSLRAFVTEDRRYLLVLPLLHLIWANMHSAAVLMVVPYAAFLCGGAIEHHLAARGYASVTAPALRQLKIIAILFVASLLATLCNPLGPGLYTFGSDILATPYFKLNISELWPATWSYSKWPYLFAGAVVLSFALNRRPLSFVDLLLAVPFLVLPFFSRRFIVYQGIIAGPILARNISVWIDMAGWRKRTESAFAHSMTAGVIILGSVLSLVNVLTVVGIEPAGLGIDRSRLPEGALRFMDARNIVGRVFNQFEWGGYILFRDYPKRTVYIDPRGRVPADILAKQYSVRHVPEVFDALDAEYGFDAVLVNYSEVVENVASRDERFGYTFYNPRWELVYWDDVSLLFLKKGGRYDDVVRAYAYQQVRPDHTPIPAATLDPGRLSRAFAEVERNIKETGSSWVNSLYLGALYNGSGDFNRAVAVLLPLRDRTMFDHAVVEEALAYAYDQMGEPAKARDAYLRAFGSSASDALSRAGNEHLRRGLQAYTAGNTREAESEFEKAVILDPRSAVAQSNLGFALYDRGDDASAFARQSLAIKIDPDYANAHYGLALIYKRQRNARKARQQWETYIRLEPNGHFADRAREELRVLESSR